LISHIRLCIHAFLLVFLALSFQLVAFKSAYATEPASSVPSIPPEGEIDIEDDINLESPTDIKPQVNTKQSVSRVIKRRIQTKKTVRPRRIYPRVKKEKISEVYKMRMEVADLMKKVKAVERAQQRKEKPTLAKDIEKKINQKADSGNDKISLTVSGHVNRAVLYIDNGNANRLKHVDNDNSPTRFRFVGKGKLNNCTTVGTNIELQVEENSTADVDADNRPDVTDKISTRKAEVFAKHTKLGDVYMGQGSTASDDVTEQDLSGTYVATQASGIEGPATSVQFIDKFTNERSGITVGNGWTGMDGNSRKNRIRYDTPQVYGLKLGASHTTTDSWDVSAKFKGDYKGYKLAAAIGFVKLHRDQKAGWKQLSGSVSAIVPLGFNVTFAAGQRNFFKTPRKTARFWLARLGFKIDPFNIGDIALAVDYGESRDLVDASFPYGNGSKLTSYGLSLVQKISRIATEIYATVRKYKLDCIPLFEKDQDEQIINTGRTRGFKDIWIVMAGARIKF